MVNDSKFSHRHNSDGTVDSICRECFATVAKAQNESELSPGALTHMRARDCRLVSESQGCTSGIEPVRSLLNRFVLTCGHSSDTVSASG